MAVVESNPARRRGIETERAPADGAEGGEMIITKRTANRWIKAGVGREVGTCVHDGWRWAVVENTDRQITAHYRIEMV